MHGGRSRSTVHIGQLVGEPGEQPQLLCQHRSLAPAAALGDGPFAEVRRARVLDARPPVRHVGRGQHAGMIGPGVVAHRLTAERVDRLGDEPGRPRRARRVELRFPASANAFRLGEQSLPGVREYRVAMRAMHGATAWQPQRGRTRPVLGEQLGHQLDGRGDPVDDRISVACVADRVAEHVAQRQGAVLAQQGQPTVPRTRHGRGEQSGAGNQVEALVAIALDGGACRRDTLSAQHPRGRIGRGGEHRGHLAAGTVEVRFDDLQDESRCHGRVKGVAALLQHGHAGRRREPVRARHHAERAGQLRPSCEHGHSPPV